MKPPLIVVILAAMAGCGCGVKEDGSGGLPSSSPNDAVVASSNAPPATDATVVEEAPGISTGRVTDANDPDSTTGDQLTGPYVSFPAVGIEIRKPEGFEQDESFHGFGQPETTSSVMALTLAGPYSEISGAVSEEQMKVRGWTFLSSEQVEVGGMPGVLVHFEQLAAGTLFLKWSLVFGTEEKTTMVTATFPGELKDELSERLKAAVLSTRLTETQELPPGGDVPFTIQPSPGLKLTPGMSKTLAYSKDGVVPAKSPSDPLFIAAPSLGSVSIEDEREFAERRLYQTATTRIIRVESTEPITIDGLEGYESLAEAEHGKSGTPLVLYQVMLFDEDQYILITGLVGADLRDEYLPEFQSMARSLRRKQP